MYTFAIVALLGLATIKLVDFVCDYVTGLAARALPAHVRRRHRAACWPLDFSMFEGWNTTVRQPHARRMDHRLRRSPASPSRGGPCSRYLTHDRATRDETLGEHTTLRRAA